MKSPKGLLKIISILLVCFFPIQSKAYTYSLDVNYEAGIIAGSTAVYILSKDFLGPPKIHSEMEIRNLDKQSIPFFDRFASGYHSEKLAGASDTLLIASMIAPLSLALTSREHPKKAEIVPLGLLYLETLMVTISLTELAKNAAQRTRPFAYNTRAEMHEKQTVNARKSFFSGHASIAASSLVFLQTVHHDISPQSKLNLPLTIATLAGGIGVAALRVGAGKHFPSDVLVGLGVGGLVGYYIPKFHLSHRGEKTVRILPYSPGPSKTRPLPGISLQAKI